MQATTFIVNKNNTDFVNSKSARPRAVYGNGCTLLFLVPFLLAGLLVILFAISEFRDWLELSTRGATTSGRITDMSVDYDTDGDSYDIFYEYVVNGTLYSDSGSVTESEYDQSEVGASVAVLFAPNQPTLSQLASKNNPPVFLFGFSVCWNIIVFPVAVGMFIAMRKNNILIREGRLIYGQIVTISGKDDSDNDYMISLKYQFRAPEDLQMLNAETTHARDDLRNTILPTRGTQVAILYRDPKNYQIM